MIEENKPPPSESISAIRALRRRRRELECRLEGGTLQEESKVLERQLSQMQKAFADLEEEVKERGSLWHGRAAPVKSMLESRKEVVASAERRVLCKEDLIRFHKDQMAVLEGYWREECERRDKRIKEIALELNAERVHHDASVSHHRQCLRDRQDQLRVELGALTARQKDLAALNAEARREAEELQVGGDVETDTERLRVAVAHLRGQLPLLEEWSVREQDRCSCDPARPASLDQELEVEPGADGERHSCIWRDMLAIRKTQLEKITSQLDRTNQALHSAQTRLAAHKARHEQLRVGQIEAESELRQHERKCALWRGRCTHLVRIKNGLRPPPGRPGL